MSSLEDSPAHRPRVTGTTHTLPYDQLSGKRFEDLCLWLIKREGYKDAEHLGASGSEQGRDIVGWREGVQCAFQCKRVQHFGPKDALAEAQKVLDIPEDQRPAKLVFIVACTVSKRTRQRTCEYCAGKVECHFWGVTELDERVWRYPEIVERFFQLPPPRNRGADFRDEAAIKMAVYMLFCSRLWVRKHELENIIAGSSDLTWTGCCDCLEGPLKTFLGTPASSEFEAEIDRVGEAVRGHAKLIKRSNRDAAILFEDMSIQAEKAAKTWPYQDELIKFHKQGQQEACDFYVDSPSPVTKRRLDYEAELRVVLEKDMVVPARQTFTTCPCAPLEFKEHYEHDQTGQMFSNVILVRLAPGWDFDLYVALPRLFVYEYVCHIFAVDHGNECFNDGWLFCAVDRFLDDRFEATDRISYMKGELRNRLSRNADWGYWVADHLASTVEDVVDFRAITWQLAALEPGPHESCLLPALFINRLGQFLQDEENRPMLLCMIEDARTEGVPDVRALFEKLPREPEEKLPLSCSNG